MGTSCLRSIARALRIPHDADPRPDAGIRLTRSQLEDGYQRLVDVGFPIERDLEDAWRHFQGWRVNYESIVDILARLTLPPPAPWLLAQPIMGAVHWPDVHNRTPDFPDGTQRFGSNKTFNTPSSRNRRADRPGRPRSGPCGG